MAARALPREIKRDPSGVTAEDAAPLGAQDSVVRVFNFAGGGFDTVMQLGVTHALLVTQGQPPDAVVGISAGAIQAVALAEVMHAGTMPDGVDGDRESRYREVLGRRVARFRVVVDACHAAPESLVDSLLPDAYQIDALHPLVPLDQPSLGAEERSERRAWIANKAGLARLYNDLLALDIPVGAVARLIRRYLGWSAVGGLGKPGLKGALRRKIASWTEFLKFWVEIAGNLLRLAPLVLMLTWPMLASAFGGHRGARHQTAEAIIFRFGFTNRVWALVRKLLASLFVLNLWVGLSWLVFGLALIHVLALANGAPPTPFRTGLAAFVGALILLPLAPTALAVISGEDTFLARLKAFGRALMDLGMGWCVFVVNLARWTLVAAVLGTIPVAIMAAAVRIPPIEILRDVFSIIRWFGAVVVLALLLSVIAAVVRRVFRRRRSLGLIRQASAVLIIGIAIALILAVVPLGRYGAELVVPPTARLLYLDDNFPEIATEESFAALEARAAPDVRTASPRDRALLAASYLTTVVAVAMGLTFLLTIAALLLIGRAFLFRHERRTTFRSWLVRRFLDRYVLGPSLASSYPLKKFLVDLFDQGYYGETDIATAAQLALGDRDARRRTTDRVPIARRPIKAYADPSGGRRPIHLGLAAANVQTGKIDLIAKEENVVDALLAATAKPPIFPAQRLSGTPYVDAASMGALPTRVLMRLLRDGDVAAGAAVHIYAVNPLPVSLPSLGLAIDARGQRKTTPYLNLIDTLTRALQLQHFRDAQAERKLTWVFTGTLPKDGGDETVDGKRFFRAYVAPIELDRTISLNKQILYAKKEDRREALVETVAMGCRAALQVMLSRTLAEPRQDPNAEFIECDTAISLYKKHARGCGSLKLPGSVAGAPGVAEICDHCVIRSESREILAKKSLRLPPPPVRDPQTGLIKDQHLRLPKEIVNWPQEIDWPGPAQAAPPSAEVPDPAAAEARRDQVPPSPDPERVCLFGGGVFRGVFQMGVLNALAMARFKPTMVAGASVGSITAAMVAGVLDRPCETEQQENERRKEIASLASVYLAIDRLVLTDRFADFIRTWTIRASQARFSIRQADTVFRKYDFDSAKVFQRTFRAVVAGLERLFYVSPYQLNEIVMAARHRRLNKLTTLLKDRAQQWLDRMTVGAEVLGAEPLRQLIEHFVLPRDTRCEADGRAANARSDPTLLSDLSRSASLIATTTNLTEGRLQVIGSREEARNGRGGVTLSEALLASSAFPGVFRPRRSWDLLPGDQAGHEYIDGGVVDNLPLEPVLQELRDRTTDGGTPIAVRPRNGPHLVIAASLEPNSGPLPADEATDVAAYWPELGARTRAMKYNIKLDMYTQSLEDVSSLYGKVGPEKSSRPPLDVKLVAVKPEWLCSTFAFHPMLGFRRVNQAKSIAHGCATTLCALGGLGSQASTWKLDSSAIPSKAYARPADAPPPRRWRSKEFKAGKCWLVPGKTCGFSEAAVVGLLPPESRQWVGRIHRYCWQAKTHTRQALVSESFVHRAKSLIKRLLARISRAASLVEEKKR